MFILKRSLVYQFKHLVALSSRPALQPVMTKARKAFLPIFYPDVATSLLDIGTESLRHKDCRRGVEI